MIYLDSSAIMKLVRWEAETPALDPRLRSLDALHLASAVILGDALTVFIAYDDRLVRAAKAAGLATAAPGR